jgi:hypothetical protein
MRHCTPIATDVASGTETASANAPIGANLGGVLPRTGDNSLLIALIGVALVVITPWVLDSPPGQIEMANSDVVVADLVYRNQLSTAALTPPASSFRVSGQYRTDGATIDRLVPVSSSSAIRVSGVHAGATITLRTAGPDGSLDTADDAVRTTTTDASGRYQFTDVPIGPARIAATGFPASMADYFTDVDGTTMEIGPWFFAAPSSGTANRTVSADATQDFEATVSAMQSSNAH